MNVHLKIGREWQRNIWTLRDAFNEVHDVLHLRWLDRHVMAFFDRDAKTRGHGRKRKK